MTLHFYDADKDIIFENFRTYYSQKQNFAII